MQTEYSAATTAAPGLTHTYLSELSADIYNKIRRQVDVSDWPVLCQALPDLIKAFAVKLGQKNSQVSRAIMHFIHKHHR